MIVIMILPGLFYPIDPTDDSMLDFLLVHTQNDTQLTFNKILGSSWRTTFFSHSL
jgi:hypothetical protein